MYVYFKTPYKTVKEYKRGINNDYATWAIKIPLEN